MKLIWLAIAGEIIFCLAAGGGRSDAAESGSYRISGTVVNSVSGAPLRQAHLVAVPAGGGAGQLESTTGADGKFAFEKVPAGTWTLTAERKGYLRQSYGQLDLFKTTDSSVITGPQGASENLVFPLNQPAAISGKVVDERGEPVPNAIVHWLVEITSAHKLVMIRKVVATDDQGEYRLFDLPPATCYLSVVVPNPEGAASESPGFAPSYYPNVSDGRAAAPIHLRPGEEFTSNFSLQRARGGVSVTVEGASVPGTDGSELFVLVTEGPGRSWVSAATLGPGQGRTFSHVPAGRYKLVAGGTQNTTHTSKWVEVGSGNVTVNLPIQDTPGVEAKVRVVDANPASLRGAILAIEGFADVASNMRPIPSDGRVTFAQMASGRYQVVLRSPQLYVKSVVARNARVVDGLVELPESGSVGLDIVAAGDGAVVSGNVIAGGRPLSGALVVLAPQKQPADPADYHAYQADSDGSFSFATVKPGAYYVFATEDQPLEFGDPVQVRPYLATARLINAEPRGTVKIQVELSHRSESVNAAQK
jgi:uncharacterized GH25 family protein